MSGELLAVSRESVSSLVMDFQRWMGLRGFAPDSQKNYIQQLKLFFRLLEEKEVICVGQLDLAAITPQVVAEYQAYLYDYISPKTC